VLGARRRCAPAGSFNNEVGLPLTCLRRTPTTPSPSWSTPPAGRPHRLPHRHRAARTSRWCSTSAAPTSGEYDSVEGIAVAKGELVEGVQPHGDTPALRAQRRRPPRARHAPRAPPAPVVTFGEAPDADVRAEDVALRDDGTALVHPGPATGRHPVSLGLVGEHHVSNALAVAAAAARAACSTRRRRRAPGHRAPASRWRMEVTERADGVTVVNDAYNANPESMRAALKALAVMSRGQDPPHLGGARAHGRARRGAATPTSSSGRHVVRLDVSRLVVVGPTPAASTPGAVLEGSWGEESVHVDDVERPPRCWPTSSPPATSCSSRPPGPPGSSASPPRCSPRDAQEDRHEVGARRRPDRADRLAARHPAVVRLFRRRGYGQEIREDGPSSHATKRGTPTMGGAVIIAPPSSATPSRTCSSSGQPGPRPTASGPAAARAHGRASGLVGFLDDFIKIRKQRSLGLNAAAKFIGQLVVGRRASRARAAVPQRGGLTPASDNLSFVRDYATRGSAASASCSSPT
jgi:hypothetical protein